MKTVIIGGGLTGLVAALKVGKKALLLEKEKELGGLLASYKASNYFIEKYYHHFFPQDKNLLNLFKELKLKDKIVWLRARVGYFKNGKIFPLNSPIEILKFPALNFFEKLKLGFFILKSKKESEKKLGKISAKEWVISNLGKRVYEKFFCPLLEKKFGPKKDSICAAWLRKRIILRSNRGLFGEKLGYLRGGFQILIDRLSEEIRKRGGEIRTNFKVSKIVIKNKKVQGIIGGENEFIKCENVISTIGPLALKKILDPNLINNFENLKFQGTACLLLSLKRSLLKNIYWLNFDAKVSFGAIIEHTNFLPFSDYGEHLVYVVSYFQDLNDFFSKEPEKNLFEIYIKEIKKIFPDFKESDINWWKISRHTETSPIYEIGYKPLPYQTQIEGLYLAGLFSLPNYPERSMEGSVRAGLEVAKLLK